HQYEFARLNIKNTIMSKRYLKKLVDTGAVSGWDDPRMPTLSGMRKRGYPAEAVKNFCAAVGVAKANSEVDEKLLEHCVRDYLNEHADRAMVVEKPLRVIVENAETETIELVNNPNHEENGTHTCVYGKEIFIEESDFAVNPPPKYKRLTPGGTVRLKGAYIIKYLSHETDENGNVTLVRCEQIPDSKQGGVNASMKVKGVIHWVSAEHAVPATLMQYESLLTDETETAKNFDDRINPNSLKIVENALAEEYLSSRKEGDAFQFMRAAYYKLAEKSEKGLVFYRIVELKDSFNK
ncbi:MAG: glutamate--tRNA ligase family protein, partial [Christensenellales bacterium]